MSIVNKAHLIGHLGKDPEIFQTDSGTKIASVTLATTEKYKDKKGELVSETEWHNIKAFNAKAELFEKYLKKGDMVAIEGKIKNTSYDDKDGIKRYRTEIIVNDIKFLSNKKSNSSAGAPQDVEAMFNSEDDDDLPF